MNSGNDWLDPDPTRAEEKYRQLRRALIEYFARKRCIDPENLADEVFSRVIEQINKGTQIEKEDPRHFAYGVAKYVYYEYVRKDIRQEKTIEEISAFRPVTISNDSDPCMKECLGELSPKEREMLERWFLDKDDGGLEKEMGISRNAVRIRIHRIKERLETCYDECNER
jgi:DNA-directed RNA polymerase specialized sigma24 family protein